MRRHANVRRRGCGVPTPHGATAPRAHVSPCSARSRTPLPRPPIGTSPHFNCSRLVAARLEICTYIYIYFNSSALCDGTFVALHSTPDPSQVPHPCGAKHVVGTRVTAMRRLCRVRGRPDSNSTGPPTPASQAFLTPCHPAIHRRHHQRCIVLTFLAWRVLGPITTRSGLACGRCGGGGGAAWLLPTCRE